MSCLEQGEEVVHDQSNGVIISNQSLVLQKVTRGQAGSYTCEASNVEGDHVSKPVVVTLMCELLKDCAILLGQIISVAIVYCD